MTDPLIPIAVQLLGTREEGGGVRTILFSRKGFPEMAPGQGFKISVFGKGETSGFISEVDEGTFGISLRDIDSVTNRIFLLSEGQWLGLRGPHGNGFPIEGWPEGKIGLLSMDMGLPAQRGLVSKLLEQGREVVISHLSTEDEPIMAEALKSAGAEDSPVSVFLSKAGDRGDKEWEEFLGSTVLAPAVLKGMAGAAVSGPREFQHGVRRVLQKTAILDQNIHVLVNRNWTTGAGWSNQDLLAGVNLWLDGPVLTLSALRDLPHGA